MYTLFFRYSLTFILAFAAINLYSKNYFDSLSVSIETLSPEEKVKAINNIPFDKMNSNAIAAIDLYQKAISIAKSKSNDHLLAIAYEKIALAYYYNGEYDLSVKSALQAIKYFEKTNNLKKVGSVYASLGYQMKRRNLSKAFEYMQKGLVSLKQSEDKKELSAAYNNYGVLHEMNNDIDSALYYYNESLNLVNELKDSIGIPYSLNNIAGAYVIVEQYEKALPYYDLAYAIRQKRNDKNGLAENNTYYGDFYFKQQKYNLAVPFYRKAISLCQEIKYIYLQKVNAGQLALCYKNLNQYDSALVFQKMSVLLKDSLLNERTNKTINNLEIQFETEKKEKQIAEQTVVLTEKELEVKQRSYFIYLIGAIGLLILIIGVFIIRQIKFKQKQLIQENKLKDEIAQAKVTGKLNQERLRIAKDLHDNIGAQLTFIISSIDNMGYFIEEKNILLKAKLNDLNDFSKQAIKELRNSINQLNSKE